MSEALPENAPARATPASGFGRQKSFRSRGAPKMDPGAAARQGRAVSIALARLGDIGKALAFLNTHDSRLDARPIDLAVASDAGFARVEAAIAAEPAGGVR